MTSPNEVCKGRKEKSLGQNLEFWVRTPTFKTRVEEKRSPKETEMKWQERTEVTKESGVKEREGSVTNSLMYQARQKTDHCDPSWEGTRARLQGVEDETEVKE